MLTIPTWMLHKRGLSITDQYHQSLVKNAEDICNFDVECMTHIVSSISIAERLQAYPLPPFHFCAVHRAHSFFILSPALSLTDGCADGYVW